MKPSHTTTPRSMDECHFALNADPVERFERPRHDWQDAVVMIGCFLAALVLVAILWAS